VSANKYTLFTNVHSFYTDMLKVLETAQEQISLIYFTFCIVAAPRLYSSLYSVSLSEKCSIAFSPGYNPICFLNAAK
jgi:hypothetical protein